MADNDTTHGIDTGLYLSADEYAGAITALKQFNVTALSWLTRKTKDHLKDQIIGNFIARGTVCLDSICQLWMTGNYQDSIVLQRTLVDRMLLLRHLIDQAEFEIFERWSFQRQYQASQDNLSDPEIRAKLQPKWLMEATAQQAERRTRFEQEPKSDWHRPNAKEIAKRTKLSHIYRVAYDYPSTEVHPMADDGKEDFARLLGLPLESYGGESVVLHNSLVTQIYLSNRGLRACDVVWRAFVSDFFDQMLSLLESGSREYMISFQKAMSLPTDISWCEPTGINLGFK